MACLLVPAATAVVTTALRKNVSSEFKIGWLNAMLWGGVIMLTIDHVISGEIIFSPPFFTAGLDKISQELLVVGLPMTIVTVMVWAVAVFFKIKFGFKKEKA